VPSRLKAVLALDVISEGSALNKRMVDFSGNQGRVSGFQLAKLSKSCLQNLWVLLLKYFLCSVCN
jgi:hypothetical protein